MKIKLIYVEAGGVNGGTDLVDASWNCPKSSSKGDLGAGACAYGVKASSSSPNKSIIGAWGWAGTGAGVATGMGGTICVFLVVEDLNNNKKNF